MENTNRTLDVLREEKRAGRSALQVSSIRPGAWEVQAVDTAIQILASDLKALEGGKHGLPGLESVDPGLISPCL